MTTNPTRVVVWSTGGVGSIAIDAIRRRPDLELVGVWVHSPDKVGRDAGELAGGLGMRPGTLRTTLARFNAAADALDDPEFGRGRTIRARRGP